MTTLGERLDQAGRRLAARHVVAFPWEDALLPVLDRASALETPLPGRFERVQPDLVAQDRHDAGGTRPLPPEVRERVRALAGSGAAVLRPHVGGTADAIARRHRADAVALGADVYFRDDRFHPEEPEGLALIAHEAAHITEWLVGPADPPATGAPQSPTEAVPSGPGPAGRPSAGPPFPARGLWGVAPDAPQDTGDPFGAPPSGAGGAFGADSAFGTSGRFDPGGGEDAALAVENAARLGASRAPGFVVGAPAALPQRPGPVPMAAEVDRDLAEPPQAVDLERLRREVVSDLMRQLRSEFERGG